MLKNYTLLITGCIQPNADIPFLMVKSSEDRKRQYIESVVFYLEKTDIQRIVFCDNSSSVLPKELNEIAKRCSKELEFLSFAGDSGKAVDQGKGYGEGEIIEYALCNSELLQRSEYFVKVTGRVIVKNIDFLLQHMKDDRLYFYRNSADFVDTKFYGMPISTYKKYFFALYHDVNDNKGVYLENVFAGKIKKEQLKAEPFAVFPNAQGISGSTGQSYSVSLIGRIMLTVRSYLIQWL